MRNFIYAHQTGHPAQALPSELERQFDRMYGQSQQLIGEAILVCEDDVLTGEINQLNERLYRTDWHNLSLNDANATIEQIKKEGMNLIAIMREDIRESTRFDWRDIVHIVTGLWPLHKKAG